MIPTAIRDYYFKIVQEEKYNRIPADKVAYNEKRKSYFERIRKYSGYKRLKNNIRRYKEMEILWKANEELAEEKRLDKQKLESHGFDENSFRFDGYHGQQRKNKKKDA